MDRAIFSSRAEPHRGSVVVQADRGIYRSKVKFLGVPMRYLPPTILLATMLAAFPAMADDSEARGQMTVLKANQIGQIFCMSRTGNDDAVISGILTDDLNAQLKAAEDKNDAWVKQNPDEKPPLGDGIPWQSAADSADTCDVGLVTLSKTDAKVEIKYTYKDYPDANYTDTLILKKVPIEGMDVGYWRIDDVIYPDGTDMKAVLVSAFEGY
jgi:hypothetical protein